MHNVVRAKYVSGYVPQLSKICAALYTCYIMIVMYSLPVTLYTFYTILNMLSEWFKPTQSGSMVLSGHGK